MAMRRSSDEARETAGPGDGGPDEDRPAAADLTHRVSAEYEGFLSGFLFSPRTHPRPGEGRRYPAQAESMLAVLPAKRVRTVARSNGFELLLSCQTDPHSRPGLRARGGFARPEVPRSR